MLTLILCLAMSQTAEPPAPKKADVKPTVTGKVVFKGKADLPATAVVTVRVQDVSLADAAARELGKVEVKNAKGFPVAFEVPYDAEKAKKAVEVALSVRVEDGGKLLYINDTRIRVVSRGAPTKNVEAPVIKVGR